MKFAELQLHPSLLQSLADAGYTEATAVQQQAIPAVLGGKDLMASSQTGSGKTAAFMLPALHLIANMPKPEGKTPNQQRQSDQSRNQQTHGHRPRFQPAQPKVLVLAPTRELALQVTAASEKYAAQLRFIKTVAILGGMPYPKQMQLLARNPQILVATPGRLIDHIESGKIDLSQLDMLVLDEADRMLDMGFIDDIEHIVAATPPTRQTLLFSATLEGQVGQMAQRITRDPLVINVAGATTKHENIEQRMHFADDLAHKNRLLDHLLRDTTIDQCVVFTATKRDADMLSERLNLNGFASAALHGDMHQGARNRTLRAVREGEVRVLVATDVAARGIDVPSISHVINYDLPKNPEDYVHRIGRTGRAGRNGLAVSLANHGEHFNVRNIERFTRQPIPVSVIEGLEPQRSASRPPRTTRTARTQDKTHKSTWKPGGKPGNKTGYGNATHSEKPHGKAQFHDKPYGAHGQSHDRSDSPRIHNRDGQSRPAPATSRGNDNQQRRSAGQRHQFNGR